MAFTMKRGPLDPYERPERPHHIHKANGCTDHRSCPERHWIGGLPEREHPHHVEYDGSTGRWGYTRLTDEEISDLAHYDAFMQERADAARKAAQDEDDRRHLILSEAAKDNPAIGELAKALGIDLSKRR